MPSRATRLARIEAGVCVYGCGAERDGHGLACARCAQAQADREAQRRPDLRAAGVCIQCGQARPVTGRYRCQPCLDVQAARMRRGATGSPC